MKIKINHQLEDVKGNPIKNAGTDGDTPYLTLKDVCVRCLLTPPQEKRDSEKEKLDKYDIYKKLKDAKSEVELKAEEITLIKKCIGIFEPPLILGQCFELIEKSK